MASYELFETPGVPIKAWTRGVAIEDAAKRKLENVARLPIIFRHVAVMPDVHFGIGAAVGVDIGCGMMAVETTLTANQLPDDLKPLRTAIEAAVPHGRTANGGRGDRGAWRKIPKATEAAWKPLAAEYERLADKHKKIG